MQAFISAGADLCFPKPLQPTTVDNLVEFFKIHGTQSLSKERQHHKGLKGHKPTSLRLAAACSLLNFDPEW
jgi:hypothetical protein